MVVVVVVVDLSFPSPSLNLSLSLRPSTLFSRGLTEGHLRSRRLPPQPLTSSCFRSCLLPPSFLHPPSAAVIGPHTLPPSSSPMCARYARGTRKARDGDLPSDP